MHTHNHAAAKLQFMPQPHTTRSRARMRLPTLAAPPATSAGVVVPFLCVLGNVAQSAVLACLGLVRIHFVQLQKLQWVAQRAAACLIAHVSVAGRARMKRSARARTAVAHGLPAIHHDGLHVGNVLRSVASEAISVLHSARGDGECWYRPRYRPNSPPRTGPRSGSAASTRELGARAVPRRLRVDRVAVSGSSRTAQGL